MKRKILFYILAATLVANLTQASPLGTSFHYNAHLKENGVAATGGYDLEFSLWSDPTGGTQIGPLVTLSGITVTDGVLSATPDFGDVFDGSAYWLEVAVRKGASGNFTTLSPRQSLDAAPYALHAPKSGVAETAKGVNQDAVHTGGLQNGAVTGSKIATKGVGNANLDDHAVSEDKIGLGAVGQDRLKDGAVSGSKIAAKGVGNGQLDDAAVTGDKIAGGHVVKSLNTLKDNVTLAPGNGILLTPLGNTITVAATTDSSDWNLSGNAGTTPAGGEFLGTTDNAPLTIRVNNAVAMRYLPTISTPNLVGGSAANSVGTGGTGTAGVIGATIAGGGEIGGLTQPNRALNNFTTIGGGNANEAGDMNVTGNGSYATIGGGQANIARGLHATVPGGFYNLAAGPRSVVGGGAHNAAEGAEATVGGGDFNASAGDYATVPGGRGNSAMADYTFAAGRQAIAQHQGSFLWADSLSFDFPSMAANEFSVRATGGVRFVSAVDPGGEPSAGVKMHGGGGSWSSLSDRNAKENLVIADGRAVLQTLCAIPLTTWNYKSQDKAIRHIGPMAQDFKAAFGLGEDDQHITTVDADGVALAAIQGLNRNLEEQRAENRELKKRLLELELKVGQMTKEHVD